MSAVLIGILSVGVALAALIVTRMHSRRAERRADREVMGVETPPSTGHARDVLGRAGTAAHRSGPPVGGPMSERGRAPEGVQAHQSPEQEIHHVPAPCDGKTYDPRPLVDNARRTIAYLLIALLALLVIALLAMVAFDVITVSDIKEFGTIFGPLVALVSAATGFYYANQGAAFSGTHTKPSRTDPHSET